MKSQQRPLEEEEQQRKRKKGRDSEEESGLLNLSEQFQTYGKDEDESCVEKTKSSLCPLLLSLILALFLGVVFYRYYWMINHPKVAIKEDTLEAPSEHEHHPYQQNQSPAHLSSETPRNEEKPEGEEVHSEAKESKIQEVQNGEFPSKLWVFEPIEVSLNKEKSLHFDDYFQNWEHYSKLSNLSIEKVSIKSFKNFITNKETVKVIEKINSYKLESSIKEKILERIIMVAVLHMNGGILIDRDIIMTKSLDSFIKKVEQNSNFSIFYFTSSPHELELENNFIMARKSCSLLGKYLEKITSILQSKFKEKEFELNPSEKDLEDILVNFEKELNLLLEDNSLKSKLFSLGNQDEIKVENNLFLNIISQNHFKYFYSMEQENLEDMIGPIKPVVIFPSKLYEKFIINISNLEKSQIHQKSFIYRHFLSINPKHSSRKPIEEKNLMIEPEKIWQLPRILWTFFTKNHVSDPLHEHFLRNVEEKSKLSGFELIILTEKNLKAIFNESELKEIESILKKIIENQNENAMHSIKEDEVLNSIVKLKVLGKFGGVFIDHGNFLLENLEWLTQLPSNKQIFNKKEHSLPDTFMFHEHGNFHWSINLNSGEKEAEELKYLSNFIAVSKDSHLIKDWLVEINKNLAMTQKDLLHKFESQCQMKEWESQAIFEITLQCMLTNRRKNDPTKTEKEQTVSENIWSMSSLFAGEKMDIIEKQDESLCYSFDSSYKDFTKKYGSIGYISVIETDGPREEIDLYFRKRNDVSVFNKFFAKENEQEHTGTKQWKNAQDDYIKDVLGKIEKSNNK